MRRRYHRAGLNGVPAIQSRRVISSPLPAPLPLLPECCPRSPRARLDGVLRVTSGHTSFHPSFEHLHVGVTRVGGPWGRARYRLHVDRLQGADHQPGHKKLGPALPAPVRPIGLSDGESHYSLPILACQAAGMLPGTARAARFGGGGSGLPPPEVTLQISDRAACRAPGAPGGRWPGSGSWGRRLRQRSSPSGRGWHCCWGGSTGGWPGRRTAQTAHRTDTR